MIARTFQAMQGRDAAVFPTARDTAGAMGVDSPSPDGLPAFYAHPFNLVGDPALSICNGFSTEGLPIAAHPFQDATVLRIGDAV